MSIGSERPGRTSIPPGSPVRVHRARSLTQWVLPVLVALIVGPYAESAIYRFDAPHPFHGAQFYNPYARLDGTWRRSNLHAHARAWGPITAGRQSAGQVMEHYRALGYDIVAVSDYQRITSISTAGSSFIPAYEHGYGVRKLHVLAIGARRVDWLDFPFWQSRSQKQFVLDRIRETADVVAIPHPAVRGGYSAEDMRYLTGYDLLEVVSRFGIATRLWDAALSAGHPVWLLGSDDSHDIATPKETGMAWTMINTRSARRADVVEALREGRAYAVFGENGTSDIALLSVEIRHDTLYVVCGSAPRRLHFIGQNGQILKTVEGSRVAFYHLRPADTYVRAEISTPKTTMYLNPIVRYNGKLSRPRSHVDAPRTWLVRAGLFGVFVALLSAAAGGGVLRWLTLHYWSWRRRVQDAA